MPIYTCEICNITTKQKRDINKHLKTKKHMNNLNNNDINVIKCINPSQNLTKPHKSLTKPHKSLTNPSQNLTNPSQTIISNNCKYCSKFFSRIDNLKRHESQYCKGNDKETEHIDELKAIIVETKNNEDVLKAIILEKQNNEEKYKKDIEHLYKQIEILMEKKGNTTTIINIDKQINLNSYGKEDLSHITSGFKDHLLKIPFVSIPKMIEAVHFSDKKPENNNIKISNKKEKYIKVYEKDKWVFKDKKSTITNLLDNNYNIIDDHYEDTKENDDTPIPPHVEKQYENFRELYNDGDKHLHNEIRVDCELVLLNNMK